MSDVEYERLREKPSLFVSEICGVEPLWYQKEFMDHPGDRKCFIAGRQVGKSRVAAWLGLWFAVTHPDSIILLTADALRQSSLLFEQMKTEINNSGLSDDEWGITRETRTELEFDNGSQLYCIPTGRNGNKIRGFTADLIIVDEAAFVDNSIFEDVLEPMTFVSDGTIVLLSTPFGKSGYFFEKSTDPNWYSTYQERSDPRDGHDGVVKRGISSYDNKFADEDKLDEFKSGKTEMSIKQEVYGMFVEAADTFFPPSVVRNCINGDVEKTHDDIYLGVDLARHGNDQTVLAFVDGDGNVFKVEAYPESDLTESVERIRNLDSVYDFEKVLVDETGLGGGPLEMLENQVGRKVQGETFSLQNKQSIYQTAKAEMEEGVITLPRNRQLKEQLLSIGIRETKSGNLSLHAKDGGRDDHVDALCLAIYGTDTSGRRGMNRGMKEPVSLGSLRE